VTGERQEDDSARRWQVATGIVSDDNMATIHLRHGFVFETRDGGISNWINDVWGQRVTTDDGHHLGHCPTVHDTQQPCEPCGATLEASCACGRVQFNITRPDASSTEPRSNFPDLMTPYYTDSPEIANPNHVKWWLRNNSTKFLAGTCACRSCRLTSGFEIQAWAFVPRNNIHGLGQQAAYDFDEARKAGVLQAYESSPGVVREFCPGCGATVFWHDRWRPELIDVSVGLLRSSEGALARGWLDWWTERVSFAEDAGVGRHGNAAARAVGLIRSLEQGLRAWVQD
jgi:hypothetical protein